MNYSVKEYVFMFAIAITITIAMFSLVPCPSEVTITGMIQPW